MTSEHQSTALSYWKSSKYPPSARADSLEDSSASGMPPPDLHCSQLSSDTSGSWLWHSALRYFLPSCSHRPQILPYSPFRFFTLVALFMKQSLFFFQDGFQWPASLCPITPSLFFCSMLLPYPASSFNVLFSLLSLFSESLFQNVMSLREGVTVSFVNCHLLLGTVERDTTCVPVETGFLWGFGTFVYPLPWFINALEALLM